MRRVGVAEAKNSLSALLAVVRSGGSVTIEDRGVPIARLEPLAGTGEAEGRLGRLVRAGLVEPPRSAPPRDPLAKRLPKLRQGAALSAALVEERRSGR